MINVSFMLCKYMPSLGQSNIGISNHISSVGLRGLPESTKFLVRALMHVTLHHHNKNYNVANNGTLVNQADFMLPECTEESLQTVHTVQHHPTVAS